MNEVEVVARRGVRPSVVTANLERLPLCGRHPRRVDVGRQDVPLPSDPYGQPSRDRGTSGTDLPATPPRRDTQPVDVPERAGVEQCRQRLEPLTGLGLPVVEQVTVAVRTWQVVTQEYLAELRSAIQSGSADLPLGSSPA